jgi:anti-sigma regulatory factor (Ser/Thr protein kinase)
MPNRAEGAAPDPLVLNLRDMGVPALVQVRRWAARSLGTLDDAHLGDVMLVATELVTNAYDHGNGPLQVRMSHTPTPCQVRVEVDDSCQEHPVLMRPGDTQPRGRGMLIVDKLAKAWGVHDHSATGSKTVWAQISCDGDDRTPCVSVTTDTAPPARETRHDDQASQE